MNGIFSSTPGVGPIRILVGTHGLMLTQSGLTLMAQPTASGFRFMVALVLALAVGGLAAAVLGLPGDDTEPYARRRHGR